MSASSDVPAPAHGARVTVEFDVPARMRDGVILRANVYRPSGTGPWPAVLIRTPYGKDTATLELLDAVRAARAGFMVVVQDSRGRFASDGEWEPFRYERSDGYDSVEWVARLPGSNGRVGMSGGSYVGSTQWLAAIDRPPSLAAIAPAVTWADPSNGLFARGGAVELGTVLAWSLQTSMDALARPGLYDRELEQRAEAIVSEYDKLGELGYWELPVSDAAALTRHSSAEIGSIRAITNPDIAEWCLVAGSYDEVQVPSLHLGGWYDNSLQGTLDNFQAMTARGHDARLVVGPWTHATFSDPIGDRVFGLQAGRDSAPLHGCVGWTMLQLAWFKQHLLDDRDLPLEGAPVRIFVMGVNEWRDESSWPPERARPQRWFLGPNGSLAPVAPNVSRRLEYVYDPADPVPTVGGNTIMWPGYPAGPIDQTAVEGRDDVLVFTSEPLDEDLEVTGPVRCVLYAESTAPATDWVVRLCDVDVAGRSLNICDGILRVHREADTCAVYEVDLWSTSNVFCRGHRLRVHVTSSSFPRWDRNLNTGKQCEGSHNEAHQRVLCGRQSYIELSVVH